MPLPRSCDRCGKRFQPYGRNCRLCDECFEKAQKNNNRNRNLKRLKK